MRKIFFFFLLAVCFAMCMRSAPASAASPAAANPTTVANPSNFWNDVAALEGMICIILDPSSSQTLPSSSSGGTAPAALAGYLGMLSGFYQYFILHVAVPGFVLLLLWYFYEYTRRLWKEQEKTPAMFFIHRALILLFATVLILPAQKIVGVQDNRPTAVWLICDGVNAGMDLAGLAIKTGFSALGSSGGSSSSDSGDLSSEINAINASCGNDYRCYFLGLPYTLKGYIQNDVTTLQNIQTQFTAQLQGNEQQNDQAKRYIEAQQSTTTTSGIVHGLVTGVLAVLAAITGIGIPTAMVLGAVSAGFLASSLLHSWLGSLPRLFGDQIFFLGFGVTYFIAVMSIVFRTLLYGALCLIQAFMLPFGRWGTQKVVAYLSNVIAFLLTPIVLAFIWFIGLIVRDIFLQLAQLIPDFLAEANTGETGLLMYLITLLSMCVVCIMPICAALTRTSSFLSNVIGGVFQAGFSSEARMRTFMAK